MKKVRSEDIARIAGVARSTVSKVVNGYPNISEETRKKVLDAIEISEYSPDLSGRVLAGKGVETLAFFLFDRDSFYTDLLVSSMIAAMIDAASRFNYHILSYIVRYPVDDIARKTSREVFLQGRADAAIIVGARNHEPLVEDLILRGNIVSIYDQDLALKKEENRLIINQDDVGTAFRCIEYLYSRGHRKIGILNGDPKRHGGVAKKIGFLNGIKMYGLTIREDWSLESDFSEDCGYKKMKNFLSEVDEFPSAFAVANDSLAFGAMRAIFDFGLSVPEDISIVAIDGHPLAEYVNPALTTFSYNLHELADRLVETVIHKLKGKSDEYTETSLLKSTLIERNSCREI